MRYSGLLVLNKTRYKKSKQRGLLRPRNYNKQITEIFQKHYKENIQTIQKTRFLNYIRIWTNSNIF